MKSLNAEYIKKNIARSEVIYKRGENIFFLGNYQLKRAEENKFHYHMDGNYGFYNVKIEFINEKIQGTCDCPFPYNGCKHIVAASLDAARMSESPQNIRFPDEENNNNLTSEFLTIEEIRDEALNGRKKNAKKESFKIIKGDTYKGEHVIINKNQKEYIVSLYDPVNGKGHCTCPDFSTNHLNTCKHLIHTISVFSKEEEFKTQIENEIFPFIHITWNSEQQKPACFYEKQISESVLSDLNHCFDNKGLYKLSDLEILYDLIEKYEDYPEIKIDDFLLNKIDDILIEKEIELAKKNYKTDYSFLKATLFPYQQEGVQFALFKKASIIADEMGLGKTIQAITIAILKKDIFNFSQVLIVTPSSLKDQWKKEIEKFTEEKAVVVSGHKKKRQEIYETDDSFFKITNYEAVMRDILVINRVQPDFIILDEAQRIKNFETKTHQAIKSIPHKQSLIITGTPLENKLEDLYAIMQFSKPDLFSPLWVFAANHFNISRNKDKKILGYKNLNLIHKKTKTIVIRRKKEDVLDSLPEQITNNYSITLSKEQSEIHQGYARVLLSLINKKFITPIDIKRIQSLLICMRMVCNSTYLIDKKTNISPKLQELIEILKELVIENKRKIVIFSEWTTMTYLIGKVLSNMGIKFIELSGKIPVPKRQSLIDEFNNNPECKVFLSTDAGGVGLNLQTADCVINFELPWNPAKLNQRIGRVNRIGQKSKTINVINLITKDSIEENVHAGIHLKQDLFHAVLDGENDTVSFTRENKAKFINKIREMFGEELKETVPHKENASPELPETTPNYLNPQILNKEEKSIDLGQEENPEGPDEDIINTKESNSKDAEKTRPEQLEDILEQGMKFLSGLSAMATGKPLVTDEESQSISVDKETGEVTLKFRLPGF